MTGLFQYGWILLIANTEIFTAFMFCDGKFFLQSPQLVAREILGSNLCVQRECGIIDRAMITETEAYDGEKDLACHASKGKTARTSVMYCPGGVWYVYLCYGMHWMLNVVTGPENYPAAVLIRGAAQFKGPGRLTKGMKLDGSWNGKALVAGSMWIERGAGKPSEILCGPRIGVNYAGPEWSRKPWRFWFSNTSDLT